MEINHNETYGDRYTLTDNNGYRLTIQRNAALWRDPSSKRRYYVGASDNNRKAVSFGFTEEQMIEFFTAFLAVKQTYEEEK